jgi:hypothetical protein
MDVNFDQLYVIEINKDIDKYLIDVFGIFYFQISEQTCYFIRQMRDF